MTEILTLAGAFAVGSLAFWGFWFAVFIGILVLVGLAENEHYGWATAVFAAFFLALGGFGIFNLYNFTVEHPIDLLWRVGIYVGIGVIWGAVKWFLYCRKERIKYELAKNDFLKANKATEMTAALRVAWTEKLQSRSSYDRYSVVHAQAPNAKDHKEKIINWMYLWPFSVLGTFLADFIIECWNWLYKFMGGVYDTIALAVWKGTEQDLASETDIAETKAQAQNRR